MSRRVISVDIGAKGKNMFEIGHSLNEAETFLPKCIQDQQTGLFYIDTIGFNTKNGGLIDSLNFMLLKRLFSIAKSVRFIIAISYSQTTSATGEATK